MECHWINTPSPVAFFYGVFMKPNAKKVGCVQVGELSFEKPVGVSEIMEYLGKKSSFVYDLCNKKLIPFHQISGGTRFFYLSEVEAAIKRL